LASRAETALRRGSLAAVYVVGIMEFLKALRNSSANSVQWGELKSCKCTRVVMLHLVHKQYR